mmetsp:Transcript_43867/g.140918  ORF Transcript_43867/g.140918 Transcript_43867/m.140918 type:complete len:712 (-) Transcript_43867:283-2418(-)
MATFKLIGRVGLLKISSPPVNALGLAVRKGIVDGIAQAEKAGAKALVLAGDGITFPAGADIAEFATGGHRTQPTLGEVIERLDKASMPTVAAMHGTALGGGLEVALACHWRVMSKAAKCGLPEVHLGLLPGAGGTQRLPRLIGCAPAIKIMTSGAPLGAAEAAKLGLADEVVAAVDGEGVAEAAVGFAEALADGVDPSRVVSARPLEVEGGVEAFFGAAREGARKAAKGELAPLLIVDAVRAAAEAPSFEAGLSRESELFAQLAAGPEARALQHVFFAERQISKVVGVDAPPRPIESAAVIGAGTMGGGIAMCFANKGIPVTLVDKSPEALETRIGGIRAAYEANVAKGKLSEDKLGARMRCITTATSLDDPACSTADLYVEAVFERLELKKAIFKELDAIAKPGALLCTNTSTLDIDKIASATSRPQDVCGTHFFSPANIMPLLENVRGSASSGETLATVMAMGKKLGKKAVLAGNCFGFIGNRMIEGYCRESYFLLEEGCVPRDVDAPVRALGLAMGPLQMQDLAGIDIGYNIRKDQPDLYGPADRYPLLADRIAEAGRLGQKTKAGWYDYAAGRNPVDDPWVADFIEKFSAEQGVTRRAISTEEVLDRCMLPMVNEGFKCLEEGIAQRESDIDIVFLYGYGFPRRLGGPMHWARHIREGGLPKLAADLQRYGAEHPNGTYWTPSALLLEEAAVAAEAEAAPEPAAATA